MASIQDFKDFTVRWTGHPKFNSSKIIEDNVVEVIVQKLEMLLFTDSKEIMGNEGYNFGADLEYYIWETKVANSILQNKIKNQISLYVPELDVIGYELELSFYEGDYRDILSLNFTIKGYNVAFMFN